MSKDSDLRPGGLSSDGSSPAVSPVPASIPDAMVLQLWRATEGKAWEPQGGYRNSEVERLLASGFVEKCAMRRGFEAFNTGLDWTQAGKIAAQAIEARRAETGTGSVHESAVEDAPETYRQPNQEMQS